HYLSFRDDGYKVLLLSLHHLHDLGDDLFHLVARALDHEFVVHRHDQTGLIPHLTQPIPDIDHGAFDQVSRRALAHVVEAFVAEALVDVVPTAKWVYDVPVPEKLRLESVRKSANGRELPMVGGDDNTGFKLGGRQTLACERFGLLRGTRAVEDTEACTLCTL